MEAMADQRPTAYLFASRSGLGTPMSANNFLKRVLHKAGDRARKAIGAQGNPVPEGFLTKLTHQAVAAIVRHSYAGKGSIKDIQAHLRHPPPNITADVYMQAIRRASGGRGESRQDPQPPVRSKSKIDLNIFEHNLKKGGRKRRLKLLILWCARYDSNMRPSGS